MNEMERNLQEWDRLYRVTRGPVWGEGVIGFLPEFLPDLGAELDAGSRILDAGTGEGRNLPALRQLPGSLHAVDGSPNALGKVDQALREEVDLRVSSLAELPWEASWFDLVAAIDVMETMPDARTVLKEFHRVLRTGGRFFCNMPSSDDNIFGVDMEYDEGDDSWRYRGRYYYKFYSVSEARALLEEAGFRVEEHRRCRWSEPAHPNFRESEHVHVSEVYLCRKAAPPSNN